MITGGWEPISLTSINRLAYIASTSTGHGRVPLSISSATHTVHTEYRIELQLNLKYVYILYYKLICLPTSDNG